MAYDWPGNVRELYQTMEQVFSNPLLGPTCFAIHLPENFRVQQARAAVTSKNSLPEEETARNLPAWSVYKKKCELDYLRELKHVASGNVTKAAKVSGISRTRLYQLIEKHGVNFS